MTEFRIKAVNWYGSENILFPSGLYARPYKTITVSTGPNAGVQEGIMDAIKRFGFNTIRFPICEDITFPNKMVTTSDYIDPTFNPDLYATPPVGSDGSTFHLYYLPVIQILDKIVAYAAQIGLRMIFDMHCLAHNSDNTQGTGGLWYTTSTPGGTGATAGVSGEQRSEAQWIAAWTFLANRYLNQPAVCGFDLVNEPHNGTWDNNASTGWPAAAERCANAIHAVNPNLLIFVEGIAGQVNYSAASGSSSWGSLWGGNLTGVATRPIVLNTPNKLVYSPHDYASVGAGSPPWLSDSHYPGFMPQIWDIEWGYITKNNIAPLWIGEFGGNFNPPNTIDSQWISALCSYINTNNIHWAYWSLNPGTQPNGIYNQSNDWKTVTQAQLDAISTLISA